ncbi:MAG: hypothetical protein U0235_06870 [Polyangiaceae bacterium]
MALEANALLRATLGLADAKLRAEYLAFVLRSEPTTNLSLVLDTLCARAEAMDEPAREFMVALVDAIGIEETTEKVQRLREEAAAGALLALERTLRTPISPRASARPPRHTKPPDYGFGRPVTLGERKSLARRPSREMIERLLADPHPDVIRRLLGSPKLVEDDVVRLAARRPGQPEVLSEIVRSTRWIHRTRVRMAVLMNPSTPLPVAARLSSMLVRQELRLVIESPHVPAPIRALCLERLERRPPVRGSGGSMQ